MENKSYQIKPALFEEALENWIWTNDESFPNGFVKIKNTTNNKIIVVFKRKIEENFIKNYNSKEHTIKISNDITNPIIVINEFYRNRLKINKNEEHILEISKANFFNKIINSNINHPNPSISLAYSITMISLLLGLISIILCVISLKPLLK